MNQPHCKINGKITPFIETCDTKNGAIEFPSKLLGAPVYQQNGAGICYASSSSLLHNYELVRSTEANKYEKYAKLHPTTSAIYGSQKISYTGGNVEWNLNSIARSPIPDAACVKQKILEFTKNDKNLNYSEFLVLIDQVYVHRSFITDKELLFQKMSLHPFINQKKLCYKNALENLGSQIDEIAKLGSKIFIENILKDCPKKPTLKLEVSTIYSDDLNNFFEQMQAALINDSPVEVSICGAFFNDLEFKGRTVGDSINLTENSFKENFSKKCIDTLHSVVVTAQKFEGGTCQILLRNSWGADWKVPGLDCACIANIDNKQVYKTKCESEKYKVEKMVGCWFPKNKLAKNVQSASFIQRDTEKKPKQVVK